MAKCQYKNFRLVGGLWIDVSGDNGTLLDFLNKYEIEIPNGCQFMRFNNGLIDCWIYVYALMIKIKIFNTYE